MTKLTQAQIRAMFAKEEAGLRSKGTIPVKQKQRGNFEPRTSFDVEQIKGTDKIVVREKGKHTGTITTKDDLGRVLRHLEKEKRIRPSGSEVII